MPKVCKPKKELSIGKKSLKLAKLIKSDIGFDSAKQMFRFIKHFKRKTGTFDEEQMLRLRNDILSGDDFKLCCATEAMRGMLTLIGKEKKSFNALLTLKRGGGFREVILSLLECDHAVLDGEIAQGRYPENVGSENQIILSDYLVKALVEKQKQGFEMIPSLPETEINSIILERNQNGNCTQTIKIYVN